jgi:FAD/FMN-containing dehydrogenase
MRADAVASFLDALPPDVPPTRDVHLKALSLPFDRTRYDLDALRRDLDGVALLDDPISVKRRSRDYYWFSGLTRKVLDGRYADLVAEPATIDELRQVAGACARHRVPLVMRGAGTGTYGQAVPLYGGLICDTRRLSSRRFHGAEVTAGAGTNLFALEDEARARGLELRMHPSTKRLATLGGYACGGSGGVGSVRWGGLREPGNLIAATVVTLEETPRTLALSGAEVGLVNRTFGTTGLVADVTIPLAPAEPWRDAIASFAGIGDALRFAHDLASDDSVKLRLLSVHVWESALYLAPVFGQAIEPGRAHVLMMVAAPDMAAMAAHLARHGGRLTLDDDALTREADPALTPVYEGAWGHTTLHAIRQDANISYLQALFPPGRVVELAEHMAARFGAELPLHLEFIRYEGQVAANGAQLWPVTSVERLQEIIAVHEAVGVFIANPHVFTVEDGSRHKRVPGDQLGFKAKVDPHGLLNPGKMTSYVPVAS